MGFTWPGGTCLRGAGRPASRSVHTPLGPRKSGIPESVLIPAPVKATMCLQLIIHRAIVSIFCSRRCLSAMVAAVNRTGCCEDSYKAALRERMYCSVQGTQPNPCKQPPEGGAHQLLFQRWRSVRRFSSRSLIRCQVRTPRSAPFPVDHVTILVSYILRYFKLIIFLTYGSWHTALYT